MSQINYSLSWEHYRKTICQGLSALQQNGEFVDMTLAADGHHVQVHKMVMSLASPYIKDLIATAQCPHPVIFLNNVSYSTLCSILEYVYTGEAVVAKENLSRLLEASQALHIHGLKEMANSQQMQMEQSKNIQISNKERTFDESNDMDEGVHNDTNEVSFADESCLKPSNYHVAEIKSLHESKELEKKSILDNHLLQYTLSNHGNLQIVLNRYIYGLKYSAKFSRRLWRCVQHPKKQCPACIVTKDNHILERKYTHNHPYHDQRILRKYSEGLIFEAIDEAEKKLVNMKKESGDKKNASISKSKVKDPISTSS